MGMPVDVALARKTVQAQTEEAVRRGKQEQAEREAREAAEVQKKSGPSPNESAEAVPRMHVQDAGNRSDEGKQLIDTPRDPNVNVQNGFAYPSDDSIPKNLQKSKGDNSEITPGAAQETEKSGEPVDLLAEVARERELGELEDRGLRTPKDVETALNDRDAAAEADAEEAYVRGLENGTPTSYFVDKEELAARRRTECSAY